MNKLEIIEALKIDEEYREAIKKGIQNIDKKNAIEISTEMAYEMLPIYEKEFPENKAPRRVLDLAVKYRENPTELNRKKLEKAATAAYAAAWAATNDAAAAAYAAASAAAYAAAFAAAWAADAVTSAVYASASASAYAVYAYNAAKAANAAAKYAYDDADYEKFCCKYIDKMLEILKREEKE